MATAAVEYTGSRVPGSPPCARWTATSSARPTILGADGRVTSWEIAHRPSNRQRNGWVVSLLGVQPADHVLEIGFGPASRSRNWPATAGRLDELRRARAPGGRIAIASQPRRPGATAATSRSAADEIESLPRRAGFTQISAQTLALSPPVICVLAAAPRPDA